MNKLKNWVLNFILIDLIAVVLIGGFLGVNAILTDENPISSFSFGAVVSDSKIYTNVPNSPIIDQITQQDILETKVTKVEGSYSSGSKTKGNYNDNSDDDDGYAYVDDDYDPQPQPKPTSKPSYNKVDPNLLAKFQEKQSTKGTSGVQSEPKVRAIIKLDNVDNKEEVLSKLSDFDKKVDMKQGFAGYVTLSDLQILDDESDVNYIYEDKPLSVANAQSFPQINVDKAANAAYNQFADLTGKGQTVCIIDTGVDYRHDDLGNCTGTEFYNKNCSKVIGGWDLYNSDNDPNDDNGHGTSVAGIIAGNGSGYKGIAPDAKIVAVKITDSSGGSWSSHLANGIDWCVDNASKFNITMISIGVASPSTESNPAFCDVGAGATAIGNAVAANITVFAPTGNGESTAGISSPACNSDTIATSAVADGSGSSPTDTIPNSTIDVWGPNRYPGMTDVMAPGSDIYVLDLESGSKYGTGRGTSYSSAHAVGSAMLLKEYYEERYSQELTPNEIRSILNKTGKPIYDANTSAYYPRLDVLKAIHYEEWAPVVSLETANNSVQTEGVVSLEYNASDDEHGINNCTLFFEGSKNATHYYKDTKIDTCSEQWNLRCDHDYNLDNTFDSCDAGGGGAVAGGGIVNVYINDTHLLPNNKFEVTCEFNLYNSANVKAGIYYYNGSGWRELFYSSLPQEMNSSYKVNVEALADDVIGKHWVRCAYQYNSSPSEITNQCADAAPAYVFDNDDIYFHVTDDVERAKDREEGQSYSFDLDLANGSYSWYVSCYDDSSIPNKGTSETYTINVQSPADTEAPTYSNLKAQPNAYVQGQTYYINATWTDNVAVDKVILEFDGTNYTDAIKVGDEYYKTFGDLSAGNYDYRWYANDTSDNWNNTGTNVFTINKAATSLNLIVDPAWSVNNETQTNVSCSADNDEVSVELFRNGTLISNPDIQTLNVGDYAYVCNTSGSQNYTNAETSNILTINEVADTTPPVISNIQNNSITNQSAVVSWDTDELSNTTVNYGTTLALGTVDEIDDSVTSHSRTITGLDDNTTYYYNVTSCDGSGNCATEGTYQFKTLENSPVNQPPTIAGIPDKNVNEDTTPPDNWVDLYSYASDPDNTSAELTFTIVSESNSTLIDCSIDTNRYIDCAAPAANQSGTSDINVSVYDGEYYDYDLFTVTVNPIDDPAVWNILSNQNVDEDSTDGTVVYTNLKTECTDIDSSITMGVTSTHNHYNLNFNGNNLEISSMELNWNGLETVNLDCNGISSSFDLTVNAVNDAPTISGLPNQDLLENSGDNQDLFNLETYAYDNETAVSSLNYIIVSETNTGVVDCSIDASNNIDCNVQPSQTGSSDVTINVTDGSLGNTDTFTVSVGNVNDPPTLSGIPDKNVDEDGTAQDNWIDLYSYASDPDNTTAELTFTIVSESNSALIGCSIDSDRYIDCAAPASDQNGNSVINVSVYDGEYYDYDEFTVTVNPINDAPTLSGLPDQSLSENSGDNQDLFNLETYASDLETAVSSLTYIIVSETNTGVVDCSIDGSHNIDCSVQPSQTGTSTVTVNVSDGEYSATDVFVVDVDNVNDPPTISGIPDQNTDEDTTPADNWIDLWTYASDPDNTSAELTFTITGETNSALIDCSIDSDRYIDCAAPAANQSGSSDVTVQVSDGEYTDTDVFTVTVNPINDVPVLDPISNININEGETVQINPSATDPDPDTLTYSFTSPLNSTGGWKTTYSDAGNYSVNVSVDDGNGGTDSQLVYIFVNNVAMPDLLVKELQLMRPASPTSTDWVKFKFVIENIGETDATGVSWWFNMTTQTKQAPQTFDLPAGHDITVYTGGVFGSAGSFDITAIADHSGSITESDESNNEQSMVQIVS